MTRLYNTNTSSFISGIFQNGYYVDGKKPVLPDGIVELSIINQPLPTYNPKTDKVQSEWIVDLIKNQYICIHDVIPLSEYEISMQDWLHPEFGKRIIAPKQLIFDDTGIKMLGWFQVNNLPVESLTADIRLYCSTILPEHQAIVDMYRGIITIETRPEP